MKESHHTEGAGGDGDSPPIRVPRAPRDHDLGFVLRALASCQLYHLRIRGFWPPTEMEIEDRVEVRLRLGDAHVRPAALGLETTWLRCQMNPQDLTASAGQAAAFFSMISCAESVTEQRRSDHYQSNTKRQAMLHEGREARSHPSTLLPWGWNGQFDTASGGSGCFDRLPASGEPIPTPDPTARMEL